MTRCMSGRREKGHAAVAEHVMVPLQLCDGMAGLEAGLVIGAGPFVFGLLDVEHCRGKHLDIADMVGMGVRDGHGLDVGRRDASWSSCAANVFGRRQKTAFGSAGARPFGIAATASDIPVSQRNQPWACLIR